MEPITLLTCIMVWLTWSCYGDASKVALNLSSSQSLEEIDFNDGSTRLSQENISLHIPVQTMLTPGARKITFENLTDDLDTWVGPEILRKKIVYYLSGYDYEDRPIWIVETKNLDIRDFLESGAGATQVMDKFLMQMAYRFLNNFRNSSDTKNLVEEVAYIQDIENIELRQLFHNPTVSYVLRAVSMYRDLVIKYLGTAAIINSNAASNNLANLVRPIFREAMSRIDFYGTNKIRWLAALHSKYSPSSLPPSYGGNAKPLLFYGIV